MSSPSGVGREDITKSEHKIFSKHPKTKDLSWQKISALFKLNTAQFQQVLGGLGLEHDSGHRNQQYRHFSAMSLSMINWEKA